MNGEDPVSCRGRRPAELLRWHRRIGVTLAIVLIMVAVTGLLLNHAEALGLRGMQVRSGWLYRWYGMQPEGDAIGFDLGTARAVWLGGTLHLDARAVTRVGELRGAVKLGGLWAAASVDEIVLLTESGEVVERLEGPSVPTGIARVGVSAVRGDRLVVATTSGRTHVFDEGLVRWAEAGGDLAVQWSERTPVPSELSKEILANYRGEGLSVHRLVVDLHSGRLFGRAGVIVVDLAGIGILFLTVSGITIVLRSRRR